jgi:hypothetical protein
MIRKTLVITFGLLLGLITLVSAGCNYLEGIDGNGKVVKETRSVQPFDGIKIGGAFKVFLNQGSTESVVVEADENLMSIIETDVRDGKLIVGTEENIRNSKKLNVYITIKKLKSIDVSGAVELKTESKLELGNLDFQGSGASEIKLNFTADHVEGDFSGASEIELEGSANSCRLNMSGASELDAEGFVVKEFDLELSGAGDAEINVTDKLNARVSGAANVRYTGDPKVDSEISGAGSVRKR